MKLSQLAVLLSGTTFLSSLMAQEFEFGKFSIAWLQHKNHPFYLNELEQIWFPAQAFCP
jgi:hypothetical protein